MAKVTFCSYLVLCLILLSGCGGGTAGVVPLPIPENKGIVFSCTLNQGLTNTSIPIKAIEVSFVLPAAVSPVLNQDGSLLIGETGLKNLKTLNSQGNIPSGSYDPNTHKIIFTLLPNDVATSDLGVGDIARLTYVTTAGVELSSQEILNTLSYKVVGPGSVDLSSEIVPSVRIVTYQKP